MKNNNFIYSEISEINKEGWGIFLSIITFTLLCFLAYSTFFERKYHLNRKLLLRLLKNKEIKLEYMGHPDYFSYIDVYEFNYKDKNYVIWHFFEKREFALGYKNGFGHDIIGLFMGDIYEQVLCKKIMKYFKKENMNINDVNPFNINSMNIN